MLSAKEALEMGTTGLKLAEMLKIADQRVRAAVTENLEKCVILFSNQRYSRVDIRNFKIEVNKLGYRVFDPGGVGGNSYCIELSW